VIITARDTVAFDGVGSNGFPSGAFSTVEQGGIGEGGDINITTGSLAVTEGAVLSARSAGQGNAGNLNVSANSVLLDNRGRLIAETASGGGGNINLQVEDLLLMRRNSLISAQAFNNGNGGNIEIQPGLIVAIPAENSDIIADAERGNGGNIDITTQGIFGLEFRRQGTPKSGITASSRFGISGTVNITELSVDPNPGLTALPSNLVDRTNQIDQGCSARGANPDNKFAVTGRGGLPSSPNELFAPDMVLEDFGTPVTETPTRTQASPSPRPTSAPKQLVEAQGWIIGADGQVILTASAPNVTPQGGWQPPVKCQVSQTGS
jgi:large exoprotein involved in heme utilization and adhesion